jgi:dolichol-phosphate mannosyltransferase
MLSESREIGHLAMSLEGWPGPARADVTNPRGVPPSTMECPAPRYAVLHVVLIVRDQSEELSCLLHRLEDLDLPLRVLVVDDGSKDGTAQVVENHPGLRDRLGLVQHVRRHGCGLALAAGLRRVLQNGTPATDLVLTLPPCSSVDPACLAGLLRRLEAGMEVVVGTRRVEGGSREHRGHIRTFWDRFLTGLLRFFFPLPGVFDYTSGVLGFRLSALERAFALHGRNLVTYSGEAGTVELLIRLGRMGARMGEVPWVEGPGTPGPRHRVSLAALWEFVRMVLALAGPWRRSRAARPAPGNRS